LPHHALINGRSVRRGRLRSATYRSRYNRFKCVAVPEQIRANIVEAAIVVGDDVEAGELLGDLSFELDDMVRCPAMVLIL
jgi:hypothetical protein